MKDCTCLGTCRGAEGLGPGWRCAVAPERCEGRYPVPQTAPPRDEPFPVTYRCGLPNGHGGPHGDTQVDGNHDERGLRAGADRTAGDDTRDQEIERLQHELQIAKDNALTILEMKCKSDERANLAEADRDHAREEREKLQAELTLTDKLLAESNRVLYAIPECPVHGPCIPHALEWVKKAIAYEKQIAWYEEDRKHIDLENAQLLGQLHSAREELATLKAELGVVESRNEWYREHDKAAEDALERHRVDPYSQDDGSRLTVAERIEVLAATCARLQPYLQHLPSCRTHWQPAVDVFPGIVHKPAAGVPLTDPYPCSCGLIPGENPSLDTKA